MCIAIEISITFETAVNIGSGAQAGTFAQRAMAKDRRGRPYIPASTLKGRLRHEVERLAAGMGQRVCRAPTPDTMCRGEDDGGFCAVCRIFGSPWRPGTLHFNDLKLGGPDYLAEELNKIPEESYPRTQLRYGVALSRRRRVAAENLLFATELFQPGVELTFKGTIEGPISIAEAGLVVAGLRAIHTLGGGKSGGLGWCRMTIAARQRRGEGWVPLSEAELRKEMATWH